MKETTKTSFLGRFSIGVKLASIPILFLIAFAGTLAYTIVTLQAQKENGLYTQLFARQRVLNQIHVKDVILASQGYGGEYEDYQYARKIFYEAADAFLYGGSILRALGREERVNIPPLAAVGAIHQNVSEQRRLMEELSAIADELLQIPATDPRYGSKLKELLDRTHALHVIVRDGTLLLVDQFESETEAMIRWEIAIAILVGLLGLILIWLIMRGILAPIRNIVQRANQIAAGDLTAEVPVESRDELGELAASFNKMVGGLKGVINEILSSSERLSSSSQQLSSSAQEMNATTQEVSSTVQQIAKGTENTAKQVEETSKVMEQMSASVTQVASSAQQTGMTSAQAHQAALKGGEAAEDAVSKMNRIFDTVSRSSEVIQKLGQRSEQINEIVNVITDIADQTNLLALNAAIEAARAGEAGRGFAVVAEEVRKLAEGSAKAADQISGLIREIQKETDLAVKSMEVGSKEVAEGKETATKAKAALDEIIKSVSNTAVRVEEISASTQQMSAGTKQVLKSVGDIASNAEETASATEETSSSTEEMTAAMEEMAASAQELAQMAIGMRELVSNFKVDGRPAPEEKHPKVEKAEVHPIGRMVREKFVPKRKAG